MEGLSARVRATLATSGPDGADGLRRAVQRLASAAGGASSASDARGSSTAAARDRLLGGTLPPFEQFLPEGWSPPVLRSLEPQMLVRGRVVSVRPVGAVVMLLHAWPPGVLPSDSLAAEASPAAQTRPMDRTSARGVVQHAERNGVSSEGAPAGLDLSRARVVALLHTSRVVPEGTLLADGCEVHPFIPTPTPIQPVTLARGGPHPHQAQLRARVREGDELTAVVLGVHAPQRRVALSLRPSDCAEPRAQPLLGSRPPATTRAAPRKPGGSDDRRQAAGAGGAGASTSGDDEAARLLPDGAMELWPTLNERLLRAPLLWQPRAERQMRELLGVSEHVSCRTGQGGLQGTAGLLRLCRRTGEGGGGGGGEGGGEEPNLEEVRQQQNRAWAAESVARGVAHAKAGREAEALAAYRQALELDPRHCDALVARGAAHANAGRLHEAVGDFERALSLQPDERNARRYLHATVTRMTPAQRRLVAPQVRQLLQPPSASAPQSVAPAAAAAAAASAAAPAPAAAGRGLVAAVAVPLGGAAAAASAEVRSTNGGTSGDGSGGGSAAGGASAAAVSERARALEEMVEALRRKEKRERRGKRKKKRERKQGKRKSGKKKRARDGAEEPPRKRKRSPKESAKESGSARKRRHHSPSESSSSSSSSTGDASPSRDDVAAQRPSQGSALDGAVGSAVACAVAAPAVGLTPGLAPARVVRLDGRSETNQQNPEEDRDTGNAALERRAARFGGGASAMLTSELQEGAG